jgi:hypothetical protein
MYMTLQETAFNTKLKSLFDDIYILSNEQSIYMYSKS